MDKQREKLIELIEKGQTEYYNSFGSNGIRHNEYVADCLLANGVIVPPCKVGDKVYPIEGCKKYIQEFEVKKLQYTNQFGLEIVAYSRNRICYIFDASNIGETVFLSREDAEKALAAKDINVPTKGVE